MHWSAIVALALAGSTSTMDVAYKTEGASFASYTDAWHAAHAAERPMLVILNPGPEEGKKIITEDELRADGNIQPLLDEYVVAVIDTTTEHGQKVHELFNNAPLPRVVVIDKEQKKQIFTSSETLTPDRMVKVLEQHKSGAIAQPVIRWAQPVNSNCPSCQRRYTF